MKKTFQKTIVLMSLVAGVLVTSLAMAGVGNVSNTKHNFKVGGGSQVYTAQAGSGADQVCVFCHTPHNAGSTQLLWNKANNSTPTFRLYTSSKSLTTATRSSVLDPDSPSLLCLGCHDGKTAMNILHSSSVGVDAAAYATGYPAGSKLIPTSNYGTTPLVMPGGQWNPLTEAYDPSMNLGASGGDTSGTNLTDDHPIGFSYSSAYSQETNGGLFNNVGMDSKIRFFGPNKKVECSTCHDPHVDTTANPDLKPFLVKSNVGSGLCLTCHNK
ncbi:MAG: cytochrome c3 family protein [Desulfuromonadaceae bacterium]